ncbi:pyridoxamine 5'-phosphate oxidase family protein [Nonomuraea dietziae]|uniref:Putative pyridoxine 5'-phosphate oxidase superfamily flavin-nucleotide-binding protein n=1 Tax=Nonomuraea dietziae TaxID=65515 RepID=A0A7W5YQ03_9ACTN|nr:pyridoxamine 5'-phosphate oxidase family protein [Nonomuraea dietziae]MBB3729052.1 putative pyridoxine 5'-phosphate oxidase superfamily flavin-nucleotide-binding protein [Nonomuraea dietziae]
MGKIYEKLTDRLREFISAQPVYFVATAPESGGHVNVSPKGYADTFAILDDHTVAYLDLDGSGVETIAHLRENGRITMMFCAFHGPPTIVRLYGTGRVVTQNDPDFAELLTRFGPHPGVRSIIVVHCDRISDSCGYAVPFMAFEEDRGLLDQWAERKDVRQKRAYRAKNNRESIDGLPGLSASETDPVATHS